MPEGALAPGPDGRPRCRWALSTPDYVAYHDEEWGRPVLDDRGLYERITLEAFQSGLSWLTILRKREAFRAAFEGFDPERVAAFGDVDVDRLLGDAGIVRNRAKILAAMENARATARMRADGDSLADLVWSFAPERRGDGGGAGGDVPGGGARGGGAAPPRTVGDLASVTDASRRLARELKRRGFRFVGPTTAYAAMQACGVVNDHLDGCLVRADVEAERARALETMA